MEACYIELHCHSSHSLLDGVNHPAELARRAADYEMPALALTDHDGLYGTVPFIRAAESTGIKPIVGAELTMGDGSHLTLLAENKAGYANLCRLITLAHQDQPKGVAALDWRLLEAHRDGLFVLSGCAQGAIIQALRKRDYPLAQKRAQWLKARVLPEHLYIEMQRHYLPGEARLNRDLLELARLLRLPVVATGNVHYLDREDRDIQDVLTCTREHVTLADGAAVLHQNDEYLFRTPEAMTELFRDIPEALSNSIRIAERCEPGDQFLRDGAQVLPRFSTPDGSSPVRYLHTLCEQAMRVRYPDKPPKAQLHRELNLILELRLENYFLIVADMVEYARSNGIRCQGRGSAANSLVAYLLSITPIDPIATNLVFERFLSRERSSTPDIDIDFAADRREEVIQYVYERYGRDHAAMACTLVTYRARSAVRDTARALGFPPELVERVAATLDVWEPQTEATAQRMMQRFGADLSGAAFQNLLRIAPQLEGLPRHLGIHSGGMILSGPPLSELVPLEPATMENRTVVQWDKISLESAGMIKIDILGLRMLGALEDAVTIAEAQHGIRPDLDNLTLDDPKVFEMIREGKTIGVFQVESQAQLALIPNYKPQNFSDLIIQVALIRPGPLQANMVRPYLKRRRGLEPVSYTHPLLKDALEETLGLIVFQEQVLKVARDLAGFTPGEGELLRRALGGKQGPAGVEKFEQQFMDGAVNLGVERQIAEEVFDQLKAFGGYAFAKSHAAAFAVITYQSAWLRCYYPVAFFTSLLRHQPMGYYAPNTIVAEARRQGIDIHSVDIHNSDMAATVQNGGIRLGLNMVRGLQELASQRIIQARKQGQFESLDDFYKRTQLGRRVTESLILGGAFDSWNVPRRQLLWRLSHSMKYTPEYGPFDLVYTDEPEFAALEDSQRMILERNYTGVTAKGHITSLVREKLQALDVIPANRIHRLPHEALVHVGGLAAARRPPTANGTVFVALEDDTGFVNVILWPKVAGEYREVLKSDFLVVKGRIQRDANAVNVIGEHVLALEI